MFFEEKDEKTAEQEIILSGENVLGEIEAAAKATAREVEEMDDAEKTRSQETEQDEEALQQQQEEESAPQQDESEHEQDEL